MVRLHKHGELVSLTTSCISCNGVRQGGILSTKLFSVYVGDLSDTLIKSKTGCHIDNLCMNQVMYADNIYLMARSPVSLQKLIDIGYDFSAQNNLSFNSFRFSQARGKRDS